MTTAPEPIDAAATVRCSCGLHAVVFGTVPDPECSAHGFHGVQAWSTCEKCGRAWRHVVGHACEVAPVPSMARDCERRHTDTDDDQEATP